MDLSSLPLKLILYDEQTIVVKLFLINRGPVYELSGLYIRVKPLCVCVSRERI